MTDGSAPAPTLGGRSKGVAVRVALLAFWCLVFWGTFLGAAAGWTVLTRGPRPALSQIARLSLLNLATMALATLVWTAVGAWALRARKK